MNDDKFNGLMKRTPRSRNRTQPVLQKSSLCLFPITTLPPKVTTLQTSKTDALDLFVFKLHIIGILPLPLFSFNIFVKFILVTIYSFS